MLTHYRYYASLGAVGDFSDALILFAFARQTAVDVDNKSYYYECLADLAVGRKSEELEMQVAVLGSQGFTTRREVDTAYRYFGIDPSHAIHLNDEHIIGTFKSRLSDVSAAMVEDTRRQLRIIGEARDSAVIRAEAAGALETYEQALSWLDLSHDQADDFVPTMVSLKVCLLCHCLLHFSASLYNELTVCRPQTIQAPWKQHAKPFSSSLNTVTATDCVSTSRTAI
jgi:ubiquitin carboxyl-terminal hydrolase 25/28